MNMIQFSCSVILQCCTNMFFHTHAVHVLQHVVVYACIEAKLLLMMYLH